MITKNSDFSKLRFFTKSRILRKIKPNLYPTKIRSLTYTTHSLKDADTCDYNSKYSYSYSRANPSSPDTTSSA